MSATHVLRIAAKIKENYFPHLDNDNGRATEDQLISRGVAAMALSYAADVNAADACFAVTDGFDDNGIDAILIDDESATIFLVQAKWIKNGGASPDRTELLSFLKGVEDIVACDFSHFNERIKSREEAIAKALYSVDYKVEAIIAYTGTQKIAPANVEIIEEKLKELNNPYSFITYRAIDQGALYNFILKGSAARSINLENVTLYEWGIHHGPHESISGEIEAVTIAQWYKEHSQLLLAKNLRKFKGNNTTVNANIRMTVGNNPEDFWYFNNGITVLCTGIEKAAAFAKNRVKGIFSFRDVSIVNGAQTYGSIGEYFLSIGEIGDARVQIRFINLQNASSDYFTKITRYTNTQNRIDSKDFASLDPIQKRLRDELALDSIDYTFRAGDPKPLAEKGCDLEDATIALACAYPDISVTILVSREIGKIWEDYERKPYKLIFNTGTTSNRLWLCVKIMRIVNELIAGKEKGIRRSFESMALTYGSRFLLHKVFQKFGLDRIKDPKDTIVDRSEIARIFDEVLRATVNHVSAAEEEDIFMNIFFKNPKSIHKLSEAVDYELKLTSTLFN